MPTAGLMVAVTGEVSTYLCEVDLFDHALLVSARPRVSGQEGFSKRTFSDLPDDLVVLHHTWKR